jgi:monofunctional chorismate mutase
MTLKELRNQIDQIDDILRDALEKRFDLVEKVKEVKKETDHAVFDPKREQIVLEKCKSYKHSDEIEVMFEALMTISKDMQVRE